MPNDAKTMLARKAVSLGQLSKTYLPPFPALPDSFVKRFPTELGPYNESVKRFNDALNHTLEQLLSAQKT